MYNRYIATALALLVLPFLAITYQASRIENGTTIRLPVKIGALHPETGKYFHNDTFKRFSKINLKTPLNTIDTTHVTGHNNFKKNQTVFVFLSPGPNNIWYPYTLSKQQPKQSCHIKTCLVLRGHVRAQHGDILTIRYQYEVFSPTAKIEQELAKYGDENLELILSVGANGHSTVRALNIAGETFPQRKLRMSALLGFTHNIANAAPVR